MEKDKMCVKRGGEMASVPPCLTMTKEGETFRLYSPFSLKQKKQFLLLPFGGSEARPSYSDIVSTGCRTPEEPTGKIVKSAFGRRIWLSIS